MKILVTCFDPFGGEKVNPASLVVERLKDTIAGLEVIKLEIPTVFYDSIQKTTDKIAEVRPDYVLSIGQAGGRNRITVERVAINQDDARIPDNKGQAPIDLPIDAEGEAAYFATLPIKAMVRAMMQAEIPAEISNTAGTYVCNHIMYGVLNYIHKNHLAIPAGFMHIPFIPEQVVDKPSMPSLGLDTLTQGVELAIGAIANPEAVPKLIKVEAKTH